MTEIFLGPVYLWVWHAQGFPRLVVPTLSGLKGKIGPAIDLSTLSISSVVMTNWAIDARLDTLPSLQEFMDPKQDCVNPSDIFQLEQAVRMQGRETGPGMSI